VSHVIEAINKQVANWSVLYVKLHNFHWHVKGPQFFTLHAKFEELYNEAALHIDELAERILALQGRPLATMSDYLAHSSISEASGSEEAHGMVEALVSDYTIITGELKAGMETAAEAGDNTTADMFLAIFTELEKHIWMLRSFLK